MPLIIEMNSNFQLFKMTENILPNFAFKPDEKFGQTECE